MQNVSSEGHEPSGAYQKNSTLHLAFGKTIHLNKDIPRVSVHPSSSRAWNESDNSLRSSDPKYPFAHLIT